jgi:hypothetical protein
MDDERAGSASTFCFRRSRHDPGVPTPRREWLAVLFPPAAAAVLLSEGAFRAASADHGWLVFGIALIAGVAPPAVYTVVLLREGRLFLRDADDVERNRVRLRVGVPLGWLLGATLVVVLLATGGSAGIVFVTVLGGLALGLWPGLLANFVRLRREVWRTDGRGRRRAPG